MVNPVLLFMKKTSVLTSLPRFGSIGNMKSQPTYIRHMCKLRSPNFWQIVGEYVPKMATCMTFALLYICIHIINKLKKRCTAMTLSQMVYCSDTGTELPPPEKIARENSGTEIQEYKFSNAKSGMRISE